VELPDEPPARDDQHPPRRRPARSRRALVGWALVALGLAAVVLVVWGGLSALSVRTHASAAAEHVGAAQDALDAEDLDATGSAVRAASRETRQAAGAADALPLRLAALLPGRAGDLVADVRTVVGATDLAVSRGAVPLVGVVSGVQDPSGLLREDGSIDLDQLEAAAEEVRPAAAALEQAQARLDGVDAESLPGPLRDPVRSAQEGVRALAARASGASAGLSVMPAALGAEGPRSYLVVFQNPAEVRPTGGIVGTWAMVTAEDGRTRLDATGSNDDLERLAGRAVRDLGPEYAALYPPEQVAYSQNVNLSPHFPDAGLLLSDLWVGQGRPAPDGVIAVDPQGMAPLLEGAGEVAVPGGPSVSADTVVDVILRVAYEDFAGDNTGRSTYLSTLVGTAFAQALGGGALEPQTLRGLLSASEAGHVLVWSAHEEEQAALERAQLAGALPEPAVERAGVYLTNVAASKLDYYLTSAVTTSGGCDGAPPSLALRLGSTAPERVPRYVANKRPGADPTTESLLVALYLPPERGVAQVLVDGQPVALSTGTERGWSVARFTVDVPRDREVAVDVGLTGAAAPITDVFHQALVRPMEVSAPGC